MVRRALKLRRVFFRASDRDSGPRGARPIYYFLASASMKVNKEHTHPAEVALEGPELRATPGESRHGDQTYRGAGFRRSPDALEPYVLSCKVFSKFAGV